MMRFIVLLRLINLFCSASLTMVFIRDASWLLFIQLFVVIGPCIMNWQLCLMSTWHVSHIMLRQKARSSLPWRQERQCMIGLNDSSSSLLANEDSQLKPQWRSRMKMVESASCENSIKAGCNLGTSKIEASQTFSKSATVIFFWPIWLSVEWRGLKVPGHAQCN